MPDFIWFKQVQRKHIEIRKFKMHICNTYDLATRSNLMLSHLILYCCQIILHVLHVKFTFKFYLFRLCQAAKNTKQVENTKVLRGTNVTV